MDSHSNPVEYAQMLIDEFERSGLFDNEPISKDKMHQHLLNASIKNLEETGEYTLSNEDALGCYESTVRDYIDSCIADAVENEVLAIDGITDTGELSYKKGPKADEFMRELEELIKDHEAQPQVITVKFESFPGFGSSCLN